MEVTVIGTGYVGTVTGACLAYLGHRVTCVDTDEAKIASLQRGESPIYEPCLEEMMALAADAGGSISRPTWRTPCAASDVIFIAVGTPPLPSERPTLPTWKPPPKQHRRRHGWVPLPRGGEQIDRAGGFRQPGGNSGARRHLSDQRRRATASASAWPAIRSFCAKAPRWPIRSTRTASWSAADAATLDAMRELYRPLVAQAFDAAAGRSAPVRA